MKPYVKLTLFSILTTLFTIGSLAVAANKKVLICHIILIAGCLQYPDYKLF